MANPTPHGAGVRGFSLAPSSRFFNGRFGRMFRALPPADFGDDDIQSKAALHQLGEAMVADEDPPKDGPDGEESGIPAAYTYLGQFIDHDLTFDPASSLQRQNDPDALIDFRTPRFDLDSVYGRGPDDQPYLYADGRLFLLGDVLTGNALGQALNAHDLPRSSATPARAIIGDPRNDENVIVSQFQGLFLRFHNKVAADHAGMSFTDVQQEVRFHYQWLLINDFLPTVVSHELLHDVLPHLHQSSNIHLHPPQLLFYRFHDDMFMPLEFSAAAYRFGHSMVRPGYRLNDDVGPFAIFPLADRPGDPGLTGFHEFPRDWAIDWGRFLDLEPRPFGDEDDPANAGNPKRTQLAYRIDTSLVNPLSTLPPAVATDPASLPERNLLRGWRMRLPSGQTVARAMGVPVLADSDIKIGKFTGTPGDIKGNVVEQGGAIFAGNCPLWTYVLAETEEVNTKFKTTEGTKTIKTRRLGKVGGRIVTETFVGILAGDSSSYLNQNPLWKPSYAVDGEFGLRELVKAALEG
ncbi:MAG TPA: heme peroxidase family protein [Solirubrobacteraceae bacterium]|nr:heme peroxidase family protein [Solirubrobacteraceae bacterium]